MTGMSGIEFMRLTAYHLFVTDRGQHVTWCWTTLFIHTIMRSNHYTADGTIGGNFHDYTLGNL